MSERAHPPHPAASVLIINAGTLPGLIACWAEGIVRATIPAGGEPNAPKPLAWFPLDDRPARDRRLAAAQRQVDLCNLAGLSERSLIRYDPPPPAAHSSAPEPITAGAKQSAMLLSAAIEAASLGIQRVIWPIHAGAAARVDTDALADVCDRALLAAQLVTLDVARSHHSASSAPRTVRIDTPYADLTDAELMDLALDMDVPLHACWWCLNDDLKQCGQCAGCMRWREALATVDPAARLDIQILAAAPAAPVKHA